MLPYGLLYSGTPPARRHQLRSQPFPSRAFTLILNSILAELPPPQVNHFYFSSEVEG